MICWFLEWQEIPCGFEKMLEPNEHYWGKEKKKMNKHEDVVQAFYLVRIAEIEGLQIEQDGTID